MLGKNQTKILLRYYEETLSNFSITLQPSQASMLFHTTFLLSLSEFCGQIFENIFFFLDFLFQKIFFDRNHRFQLFSTKNDRIISFFLIPITLPSLSVSHSIMSSVCKKKKKQFFSMKTILLLLTKSLNTRKFCFSVCSLSFFRFSRFRF